MTNQIIFESLGLDFTINRVAFSIGNLSIYWYGIFIALGLSLAVIYGISEAKKVGLDQDDFLNMLLIAIPVAIICARAYYVIFSFDMYKDHLLSVFNIRNGGIAIYGGIIGTCLVIICYCRTKKISIGMVLDILAVGLLIGQSIGRWGNFVNGEAFGYNTTLPWAMTIKQDSILIANNVHPTFLYESLWNGLGILILLLYKKITRFKGELFCGYTLWYGLGRMWIEGLRADSLYIGDIRVSQALAILTLVVSAIIIFIGRKREKGVDTMEFKNLKSTLDFLVSDFNTPGVDCSVYKNHKEIFRYYTGYSDLENQIKVKGDELYIIFSMSKMLTCTCVLQLIEKGLCSLDDPVYKYLPEFENMQVSVNGLDPEEAKKIASGTSFGGVGADVDGAVIAKNKITIKHLLTMCAGLDYNLDSDSIKKYIAEGKTTTRELVEAISHTVLGFEPGTDYNYSLCHDVLGGLIEVLTNMSFGDYLETNICKPLGMKNTFFGVPKDKERLSKMAKRYSYNQERQPVLQPLECVYNLSDDYQSGGAGLISTTEDYIIFLDALACGGVGKTGNRILEKTSVEMMGKNHLSGKAAETFDLMRKGYGYGLGVRTHINPETSDSLSPVGEFGWDGAGGAFSMVDPVNNISLVYFQEVHNWDIKYQYLLRNALYTDLNENL